AHPAGGVAERLVPVVERNPVLPVAERLEDLALELELLFLRHRRGRYQPERAVTSASGGPSGWCRRASRAQPSGPRSRTAPCGRDSSRTGRPRPAARAART